MTPEEKHGDHPTKYNIALYWALQTITTVGYGDTAILNNYERTFAQLVMIAGVILFSAVNGSLISIVATMDENTEKEENLDTLQELDKYYKFHSSTLVSL
jgi:hypothetical protein